MGTAGTAGVELCAAAAPALLGLEPELQGRTAARNRQARGALPGDLPGDVGTRPAQP